jgi:chromosome segregation ATPase
MEFVPETAIALLVAAVIFGAGYFVIKKQRGGSSSITRAKLLTEITSVTTELEGLKRYERSYSGAGQLAQLRERIEAITVTLAAENATLKGIEEKLQAAQKIVEGKEAQQQEVKSVKVKDEVMLQGLLARYNDIAEESKALEHRLAQSMKSLDAILSELNLTQDQRKHLSDLSETLTSAGGRLRELLTEYQTVKERLDMLTQQHADLEEEYTKLVEQQLGE